MIDSIMKTILAATDGSEGGTAALKDAVVTASANHAKLLVLTVAPTELQSAAIAEELREYARAEHLDRGESEVAGIIAEDILADARQIVGQSSEAKVLYLSRAGDPAKEILTCAEEQAADVIYLGSRGRGPVGALLLGSVSRRVATSAGCRVIVVPTPLLKSDLH